MKPEDVPADLYDLALDALPGEPDEVISATTQEEVRAALAAVIPEIEKRVREQVAAEIRETARSLREDGQISQDGWRGYTAAAYIAGGESR
jgi:acyl-CoA reductase-like NAD-dependent aldehyde dehydrogenase